MNKSGRSAAGLYPVCRRKEAWSGFFCWPAAGLFWSSRLVFRARKRRLPSPETAASVSQAAVEEALEERLRSLVEAITGNDDAAVLVTLEGDTQTVYATQGKTNVDKQSGGEETSRSQTDSESSYVIVKNADGSQSALKLTEIYPQVRGVVVVTPQAEDARIKERILTAVTTAFGISSSRVCVVLSN